MDIVRQFVDRSSDLHSFHDFQQILQSYIERLNFKYFAYSAITSPAADRSATDSIVLVTNYPAALKQRLLANEDKIKELVSSMCRHKLVPFRWNRETARQHLEDRHHWYIDETATFGVTQGLTIPICGPGMENALFTAATDSIGPEIGDAIQHNGDLVHLIAIYAHAFMTKQRMHTSKSESHSLTDREREVLLWAARGKTSWETSQLMCRSQATVNYHLQQAVRKLHAANKCEAAAKATAWGLLEI